MIRTIIWLVYFFVSTTFSIFFYLYVKLISALGKKEQHERLTDVITRIWASSLVALAGGKVEVEGAELVPKHEPVLFACNHQGYFDIPLMISFVPRSKGFIAKVELQKIPMISLWMKEMHSLFLDRDNLRKSLLTMREAIQTLKEGYSLVIFPEGTRSKGKGLAEFKRGSLNIADKANVPIVPVTIINSHKMLEANGYFKISSAKIKICISPPIYASDLEPKQDKSILVRNIIQHNLDIN